MCSLPGDSLPNMPQHDAAHDQGRKVAPSMRQTGMRTAWENREIAGDPGYMPTMAARSRRGQKKNRPRRGGKLKIFSVFHGEGYLGQYLDLWFEVFGRLIVDKKPEMIRKKLPVA